jgi:hypothetical protein
MISLNFMFGVRDTSLALASRRDASSRGGRPRPRGASPKEWHRPRNEKTFHFDRLFATPGAEILHRCEFSAPGVATPRRARRGRAQRDDDAPSATMTRPKHPVGRGKPRARRRARVISNRGDDAARRRRRFDTAAGVARGHAVADEEEASDARDPAGDARDVVATTGT